MANLKKRRGRMRYALALYIWGLLLLAGAIYGLMQVWEYAEAFEISRPASTMDSYVANLSRELWDEGIAETVAAMPHEVQSDEEVEECVRELLSSGNITYVRKGGGADRVNYSLRCKGSEFGTITLVPDESAEVGIDTDKFPWRLLPWTLRPWRIESESFDFTGLYSSVEVEVPYDYSVWLNGVQLSRDYIVEENILYDVLEDYYGFYEEMPTKVRYRFDNVIGSVNPVIRDADGEIFIVDPNLDDSQFIKPCTEEELARLAEFSAGFAVNYLKYISGVTDPTYGYQRLSAYLMPGSDLDNRMKDAMDGLSWAHTSSITVDSSQLNGALALGEGFYLCDISATATTFAMGHGEVETVNNMRVIVLDRNNDVRAIHLKLY